jgi:hypothetical protein
METYKLGDCRPAPEGRVGTYSLELVPRREEIPTVASLVRDDN